MSEQHASFSVIDIHPDFIVISKSAGVDFHSQEQQAGLVPMVEQSLQLGKFYPVHRLDKITSGLIILARSSAAAEQINEQFRQQRVEKYYLAISDRKPSKKQGLISGDMKKSRRGSWKLLNSQADPAQTRFFSFSLQSGIRLFVLKPLTGRTHQLRVMMKSLGAPILGDERYYPGETDTADRGYLHAYVVKFDFDGQQYRYKSPPLQGALFASEALKQALLTLGPPESLAWPSSH
ncbi:MAG: TIGR01621 family pseudouridine synthase [Motiliproteus sp.]